VAVSQRNGFVLSRAQNSPQKEGEAMVLEIAFTLCRIAAPDDCENRRIAFSPRIPVACVFAAASELAIAVSEDWVVVHWRCIAPGTAETH
jgi:hypothetical protein